MEIQRKESSEPTRQDLNDQVIQDMTSSDILDSSPQLLYKIQDKTCENCKRVFKTCYSRPMNSSNSVTNKM